MTSHVTGETDQQTTEQTEQREQTEETRAGRHRLAPQEHLPEPRPDTTTEVRRELPHYSDRERIASYRRTAPRPPAAPAGAIITLLVGLAVLYAQWDLYPTTYQGQSDANWALLFMIVSTGAALRILMGNPGRHLVSVGAILVCGVGFVLRAFLIGGGEPTAVDAFEAVAGALLLLGGGLAAAWPALEVEAPPPPSWG